MSVVFKKVRDNMYLPMFYKSDVPLVPLEEENEEQEGNIENEEIIETAGFLSQMSKLVLTEKQHRSAVNKFPWFVIIFTALMAYVYNQQMVTFPGLPFHTVCQYADFMLTIVLTLTFGVPLEIAHGTLKIAIILITSFIAKLILTYGIHEYLFLDADRTQTYVLMALHYTNVYMNWDQIKYKPMRVLLLSLILVSITLINITSHVTYIIPFRGQLISAYLIDINGGITGFLFGFFWIYGNKEKKIIKYAVIVLYILLSLLVALLIRNLE